ncbi:hypothetical protein VOLCADRAFT_119519 [Volvox carteri f. nagariensis]|uniref:Uncharacterized protein n=1 Tax=Volvox carteri f. nagariensis TaxID=3068 RepID=D8UDS3_VOLCA|nr:uncharacterized protein VOLCADRAFT_119519 [Volvox carteri f. nagariensis]EFJ42092.1 hypothetical protein VOLCADRAFT_119519 [Volvox carteri f. nagariensis]|eukprot:XP_002956789.1 hypothetical protein VOLCADRAFT_119519 [Volvox carteri f. nagariensis]
MAMADFGSPKYGGFLRGELVYISSQERYSNNQMYYCFPTDCEYGCNLNTSKPSFVLPKGTPWIMMMDRGPKDDPCYFLDKVYNAQLAGAVGVLVADNEDEELTTAGAPDTDDTVDELRNVDISAGVIKKADADYLRDLLKGGRKVGLMLNYTASVPQSAKVNWEYWAGTTDVCGFMCQERVNFTQSVKATAARFEASGQTSFTPRFFLDACREGTTNTKECQDNCFSSGRYCARPSLSYTGKDVLRQLQHGPGAVHGRVRGQGGLGWKSTVVWGVVCGGEVYDAVEAAYQAASKTKWEACSTNFTETDGIIPILEEELMAQFGNNTTPPIKPVVIEPTIRINGAQYRGSLKAGAVLRALCAAFPTGHEPDICNENWVSDDECAGPYGEGFIKCRVSESNSSCINTFQGYQCLCGSGFALAVNPGAADEMCDDINECAISYAPYRQAGCNCDRCACINSIGSYRCTGERENMCTETHKYGGCWSQTFDLPGGTKKTLTRCQDMIQEYREKSYMGLLLDNDTWYRCGDCPPCFDLRPDGSCALRCSDLSQCDQMFGFCRSPEASGGGGGGGSSSGRSGNGVHPGFMVLVALGAAALTGFVVMAANHLLMKRRMGDEIRDIMAAYMPLQRAVWGPPPPAAAGAAASRPPASGTLSPSSAPKPAAADVPLKPTVDVFGSRGSGGGGGGGTAAVAAPAAPLAGDADPLLGRQLSGSSTSTGHRAGDAAGGGGGSTENPFL